MTLQSVLQLVFGAIKVAVPAIQEVLRPFLKSRVRVFLRIETDLPMVPPERDPIVEIEGAGTLTVDGITFDGVPTVRMKGWAKP